MNRHVACVVLALVSLVAVAGRAARAEDEPMRLPLTAAEVPPPSVDWYGMYMQGKKVGWLRVEFAPAADVITQRMAVHMDLTSMRKSVVMDMTTDKEFDAKAPFAFRGGRSEQKSGGSSQTVEVVRTDHGFTATATQGGQTHTPPVPAIDYTLSDEISSILWCRQPRTVGDKASFRSFSLDDLEMDVDTGVVTARKESLVDGLPTVFYELEVTSKKRGTPYLVRADDHGKPLSMVLGARMEARLETEDTAKKLEAVGDLFVLGFAKLDKPIGPPRKVKHLVLDVDGEGAKALVDTPRQLVTHDAKTGAVMISLGAGLGPDEPAAQKEVDEALAETVDLPIKSPEVVALAAQAVGDAKTPQEKVGRLVRFVSDYVKDESCPAGLSVAEIIAQKKGDCTEHATLFAALARAAGVPAREVGGLMYMGDGVKSFGGHRWDEVVLDGKWVPVDPTWAETELDAAHITTWRKGKGMDSWSTFNALSFRLKAVENAN